MVLLVNVAFAAGALLTARRFGVQAVWLLTVLLCLVAAIWFDPHAGLAPLMGLIAAIQIERQCSYGQVVLTAALPAALLSLWSLLTLEVTPQLAEELTAQLEAMGLVRAENRSLMSEMVDAVLRVQPAIDFLISLLTIVLAYWVGLWVARYLQVGLPAALPFSLWRPWDELIWILIAALALGQIGAGWLANLALNLTLVAGVIYVVHGLALVRFFSCQLGISRVLELLFYMLLFFTSAVAAIVLAALGLLDTWFDWRHLRAKPAGTEK